jgi:hypothetical protein
MQSGRNFCYATRRHITKYHCLGKLMSRKTLFGFPVILSLFLLPWYLTLVYHFSDWHLAYWHADIDLTVMRTDTDKLTFVQLTLVLLPYGLTIVLLPSQLTLAWLPRWLEVGHSLCYVDGEIKGITYPGFQFPESQGFFLLTSLKQEDTSTPVHFLCPSSDTFILPMRVALPPLETVFAMITAL